MFLTYYYKSNILKIFKLYYIVLYFKQIMYYIGTIFFWKISKCTIFLRNQSGHSAFVIPNLSQIFVYLLEIFKTNVKPGFEYKITFWICILAVWIHRGYCVVKSWCEMSVLKLFGIEILIIWFRCEQSQADYELFLQAFESKFLLLCMK